MGTTDWDLAGFTDLAGQVGFNLRGGELLVPSGIELTPDRLSLMVWAERRGGKYISPTWVSPTHRLLEQFVHLWERSPEQILAFARKWGVLFLDKDGWPCRKFLYNPYGVQVPEPIERWRHFSHRAYAVLNIAAKLAQGKLGEDADWNPLSAISIPGVRRHLEQWGGLQGYWITEHGGPGYLKACAERHLNRTPEFERIFLWQEMLFWLKVTDVGFLLLPKDDFASGRWQVFADYKRSMLGAVAMQLALTISKAETLYTCSECGIEHPRKRAPKPGQAIYCDMCREAGIPLREADRHRRQRIADARSLHGRGLPAPEIAKQLHVRSVVTVRRWIKKGK